MQSMTQFAPPVNSDAEISPADRAAAAILLNEGRDDFETDEPTPVDALVEPNPRDSWPDWTDADCWEDGPAEGEDAHYDALCFERFGTTDLGDWDCCPGLIG